MDRVGQPGESSDREALTSREGGDSGEGGACPRPYYTRLVGGLPGSCIVGAHTCGRPAFFPKGFEYKWIDKKQLNFSWIIMKIREIMVL